MHSSILAVQFVLVEVWNFIKAYPQFTVLDVFELLPNFFLCMAVALHDLPELHELILRDLSIIVKVHLIKEFFGW